MQIIINKPLQNQKLKIPKSKILFRNLRGKPINISRQRTLTRPQKRINKKSLERSADKGNSTEIQVCYSASFE